MGQGAGEKSGGWGEGARRNGPRGGGDGRGRGRRAGGKGLRGREKGKGRERGNGARGNGSGGAGKGRGGGEGPSDREKGAKVNGQRGRPICEVWFVRAEVIFVAYFCAVFNSIVRGDQKKSARPPKITISIRSMEPLKQHFKRQEKNNQHHIK